MAAHPHPQPVSLESRGDLEPLRAPGVDRCHYHTTNPLPAELCLFRSFVTTACLVPSSTWPRTLRWPGGASAANPAESRSSSPTFGPQGEHNTLSWLPEKPKPHRDRSWYQQTFPHTGAAWSQWSQCEEHGRREVLAWERQGLVWSLVEWSAFQKQTGLLVTQATCTGLPSPGFPFFSSTRHPPPDLHTHTHT
jgi:hypothetical protein